MRFLIDTAGKNIVPTLVVMELMYIDQSQLSALQYHFTINIAWNLAYIKIFVKPNWRKLSCYLALLVWLGQEDDSKSFKHKWKPYLEMVSQAKMEHFCVVKKWSSKKGKYFGQKPQRGKGTNSSWKREEIQWERINDELSMIRKYFTSFWWISSLFSLLFFNFNFLKQFHTTHFATFFANMCQKLKNFKHLVASFARCRKGYLCNVSSRHLEAFKEGIKKFFLGS